MSLNDVTTWVLIGTALVWLIYDVFLYLKRQSDPKVSTISIMITGFSWYSPALPLVAGILIGHWWW